MPTVILRPDGTSSETGWNASNIHSVIGDYNAATVTSQNNVTCNWTGSLSDTGLPSGTAVTNFVISLTAQAGRTGSSTVDVYLNPQSGSSYSATTLSFSGSASTQSTSAITTQQDGSSQLTSTYLDNCTLTLDPNNAGTTVKEVYVTVTYPDTGYGNNVNSVAAANIGKVNDVATADIEKIISV